MNNKITSAENLSLIVNCILLGIGVLFIVLPNIAMSTITIVLGIILASYGAITLISALVKKNGESVTAPVLFTIFGVVLLVFNNFFSNTALPLIIGVWMVIAGILGAISSATYRMNPMWKVSLTLCLIATAAGVLILAGLAMKTNIVGIFMGVVFVVYGASAISNAFIIRRMLKKGRTLTAAAVQQSTTTGTNIVKPA